MATHTQQQKPHKELNNFTLFFSETWQRFRAGAVEVIYSILEYPLPKSPGAPTNATCTISLGWNRLCTHHLKIPKVLTHELPHNHSRNPWHNHPLPCVGPYRKNIKPLDLFLILGIVEIQSSGFFWSRSLNEVLFLTDYHSQNPKSLHTLLVFLKSSHLVFFHHQKKPALSSLACIKYFPHHLILSLCRNLPANLFAEAWFTKLQKSFHGAARIAFHHKN